MHSILRRLCPVFLVALSIGCLSAASDLTSCRASFQNGELIISNSHVERKWHVSHGLLVATSFRDLDTGVEWLSHAAPQPAPYPAGPIQDEPRRVEFSVKTGKLGPVEAESLVAELVAKGKTTLQYRFQVFPDAHGISVQLTTIVNTGNGGGQLPAREESTTSTGIELDKQTGQEPTIIPSALENLELAPPHLKLTQVRLVDQSDNHNELVFQNDWLLHTSERLQLTGDLFFVENSLTRSGLIFLKEAPLPHARPVKDRMDFSYEPQNNRVTFLGEGTTSAEGQGYRFVVLAYSGGRTGRIEALQTYQRQIRSYDPKRDGMFLSNTWGDRSRDARINAAFVRKEVEAGARLGVDVVQIDDGWQEGTTSNSARGKGVWSGYWAHDPKFWQVDKTRFPNGLKPIVKLAAAKGMKFGLWFSPDSSNSFANWEKDADKILALHRDLGIDYFKIDGDQVTTKAGERNLHRFFDRVLTESHGAVTLDLDVTAGLRPGYFGAISVGPIFVENRYTDWHRYWPHQTLRNLWKLSQYVDPLRLRIEFLNNTRNTEKYSGDPLAPGAYTPAYLFATTMFANPLGWFEVSNLPPSYFQELPPLVAAWKRERARMFDGSIIPIGKAPDGVVWTGFASVARDHRSGYLLIFREDNRSGEWTTDLPMFRSGRYRASVLGGAGSVSLDAGRLRVQIPRRLQFVWVRLERSMTE